MSDLKTKDKQILESLFQMGGGYVLDFSDRTISEFFDDELNIDIYDEKYNYASGSKANRMRGFWKEASNELVSESITKLIEYIDHKILLGSFKQDDFPEKILNAAKSIASKLIDGNIQKDVSIEAEIINEKISIILNKNVFSHVQGLLNDGHFFNAVEESYKIVRDKLKSITGKEKAHEAFSNSNYEIIFGREPFNEAEADFYEGVKFLHMAIQKLRNEKAHTPARKIDKNLAIHYIVLASLAYDLIDRE